MPRDREFYRKGQFLTGEPVANKFGRLLTKEQTPPPELPAFADLEGIRRRMAEAERLLEEFQALAKAYRLPR
jgi:hypothetical protein